MSKDASAPFFPIKDCMSMQYHGLTKREYFDIHAPDLGSINIKEDQELLSGRKRNEKMTVIEKLKFNAEVEAAMRVIFADALIKELEK